MRHLLSSEGAVRADIRAWDLRRIGDVFGISCPEIGPVTSGITAERSGTEMALFRHFSGHENRIMYHLAVELGLGCSAALLIFYTLPQDEATCQNRHFSCKTCRKCHNPRALGPVFDQDIQS